MHSRRRTAVLAVAALAVFVGGGPAQVAAGATAPNGRIAYSAWDSGMSGYDVWLIDPATPSLPPVQLTTDGQYNDNPDWSPDGTRIAYDGWAQAGGPRIYGMDADPSTNDATALSTPDCNDTDGCFWDYRPAWSPDGTKIAFDSNRSPSGWGRGGAEIFVMDATGETPTNRAVQLTDTPSPDSTGNNPSDDFYASWSPDSRRLVFASSRDEGRRWGSCDLYVMDAVDANGDRQGDNLRRITFDSADAPNRTVDCSLLQPAWSPVTGSSLVTFASTRDGYFDIFVVDVDNPSDIRNITQSPTEYDDMPSWSPDGTQVVYRSSRSDAYELWSLPLTAQRITQRVAPATAVAPTPTRITANGGDADSPNDERNADWGAKPGSSSSVVLTVQKAGGGSGRVTSSPAGIACGTDCRETYAAGTQVTLSAAPAAGSKFASWQGQAGCSTARTCVVTVSAAKTVTATFVKATYALTVAKSGSGRVDSQPAGISCGADCRQSYPTGTRVALVAKPAAGQVLSHWSGACTGSSLRCTVTMSKDRWAKAVFVPGPAATSRGGVAGE